MMALMGMSLTESLSRSRSLSSVAGCLKSLGVTQTGAAPVLAVARRRASCAVLRVRRALALRRVPGVVRSAPSQTGTRPAPGTRRRAQCPLVYWGCAPAGRAEVSVCCLTTKPDSDLSRCRCVLPCCQRRAVPPAGVPCRVMQCLAKPPACRALTPSPSLPPSLPLRAQCALTCRMCNVR